MMLPVCPALFSVQRTDKPVVMAACSKCQRLAILPNLSSYCLEQLLTTARVHREQGSLRYQLRALGFPDTNWGSGLWPESLLALEALTMLTIQPS
jgi:hypothetical protein